MNIEYPMLGKHPASVAIMHNIRMAANRDEPVLLTGETGTGKQLIANAIQQQSRRRNRPYVRINCSAMSPALVESQLFGYRKGFFKSAYRDKSGIIAQARSGTLLLDELDALPLGTQDKLLEALERGDYQPCGGDDYKTARFRLLAISNVDLDMYSELGMFRKALYQHLNNHQLRVPALRERASDIPILLGYYLGAMAKHYAAPCPQLSRAALHYLIRYTWPGNIRELRNVCEHLVVCRLPGKIQPEHLAPCLHATDDFRCDATFADKHCMTS